MEESKVIFAREIQKAQQDFAKQQALTADERIASIVADVKRLCLAAATMGKNAIELPYRLGYGDTARIHKECYIMLRLPFTEFGGRFRYCFEVQIPQEQPEREAHLVLLRDIQERCTKAARVGNNVIEIQKELTKAEIDFIAHVGYILLTPLGLTDDYQDIQRYYFDARPPLPPPVTNKILKLPQ
jgi:hypothetical protein